MRPSRYASLAALCLLTLVALLSWFNNSRFDGFGKTESTENPRLKSLAASTRQQESPANRRDPRQMEPQVGGNPNPAVTSHRGENERRSYDRPRSRQIPEPLLSKPAAHLAMPPGDGRSHLLEEEIDLHTLTAKRLVLDTNALERVINGQTARLIVPTTGAGDLELHIREIRTRSESTHTLVGRVSNEEQNSMVLMVYHDGIIHGSIDRYSGDGQHLEYRMLSDGHLMVRELDTASMTADCGNTHDCGVAHAAQEGLEGLADMPAADDQALANGEATVSADTTGCTTIDVVVGYDSQARIADGGVSNIEGRIIAAVDRMNLALENSEVTNTEVMLLGTIEDPAYAYPGAIAGSMGSNDELGYLNNTNDGVLDTVTDYAKQLGADFYSFILKQDDGSAGVGYQPGRSSIVARTFMTSTRLTFAHELGHNLGCGHSWGDSEQSYHNRYGWRYDGDGDPATKGDRVRTIMAYDWSWGNGVRSLHYSNPAVTHLGAATGAANKYNVLGDARADQRYAKGGIGYSGSDPNLSGFDGSISTLGANNANTILNGSSGASYASNRATRTGLSVPTPATAGCYNAGGNLPILFTGGDHEYTATVELLKNGVVQQVIATGINPATGRNLLWSIPLTQSGGTDYSIRVTLSHPTEPGITMTGGEFTIISSDPQVIGHTPPTDECKASLSQISLTFSEPMAPASFSTHHDIHTFTGPNGCDLRSEITGFTWSDNDTRLTVTFNPQSASGYYRMVVGPQVLDTDGSPMDQDADGVNGERCDDSYAAIASVNSGTSESLIWSDMVGNDSPDAGWKFSGTGSTWQSGAPAETPASGPNASADGGTIIAQNLAGSYANGEISHAETPAIDCSNATNVSITLKAWRGVAKNDELYIDAYNGSSWQRIHSLGGGSSGINDAGWTTLTYTLSAYADGNPNFKLRFGLVDSSQGKSQEATGWQIDNITITGSTPAPLPAPTVVGHMPCDGTQIDYCSVWVEFSNPMDPDGFSLGDIAFFSGPSGNINPIEFMWISDSLLRINFPRHSNGGDYVMQLAPGITDFRGIPLDQDRDGNPCEEGDDAYTATFTIIVASPYRDWAAERFGNSPFDPDPACDPDGDGLNNLMEFAFGMDPTRPTGSPIQYTPGSGVIVPGKPQLMNAGTGRNPAFRAVFGRRKDHATAGLTYTVQFSATLGNWVNADGEPTILSSGSGQIDAVSIPFPATINEGNGDVAPRFFRVDITD